MAVLAAWMASVLRMAFNNRALQALQSSAFLTRVGLATNRSLPTIGLPIPTTKNWD